MRRGVAAACRRTHVATAVAGAATNGIVAGRGVCSAVACRLLLSCLAVAGQRGGACITAALISAATRAGCRNSATGAKTATSGVDVDTISSCSGRGAARIGSANSTAAVSSSIGHAVVVETYALAVAVTEVHVVRSAIAVVMVVAIIPAVVVVMVVVMMPVAVVPIGMIAAPIAVAPVSAIPVGVPSPGVVGVPAPERIVDMMVPVVMAVPAPIDAGSPEEGIVGVEIDVGIIVVVIIQGHSTMESLDTRGIFVVVVAAVVLAANRISDAFVDVLALDVDDEVVALRGHFVPLVGSDTRSLHTFVWIGIVIFSIGIGLCRGNTRSKKKKQGSYNTDFNTFHMALIFYFAHFVDNFQLFGTFAP